MQQIFPTQIPEGRHSRSSADIEDRSTPNFRRTESGRLCSPSLCYQIYCFVLKFQYLKSQN